MKDIMTVAVVNFKVDACNKEGNLSRICGYVEAAAKRGADLLRLFCSGKGYFLGGKTK